MSVRDTQNLTARKYDVAGAISLLDVNRYPLLAILTNAGKDPVTGKGQAMKKKATTDPDFKWYEDAFATRRLTASSSTVDPDAGNQTINITGQAKYVQVGDIVLTAKTKWVFEVATVPTADTITVGKELGGETGAGVDVAGDVWIIGNVNEEGAGLRDIKGTQAVGKDGYCQIFRTPFGVTETSRHTQTLITEGDLEYQRKKKAVEHLVDIERAFIFGKAGKTTDGAHPKRYTAGVLSIITENVEASVDTEIEFETWLESAFAHGNTEKYLLASASVVSMLNGFAKNKVNIVQSEKVYGLQITKYISPHGTLNIIKHPLLTGTTYGNYAVCLDMECLTYRYLRDTKLLTNRQNPGADEVINEYLTECGLQMEQASRHALMSRGAL